MEFSDSENVLFLCKNIDFEFPEDLQFDSFSIVQQTLLSKIVSKWVTIETPSKYILERGNILVVMGKTVDLQKLPQN